MFDAKQLLSQIAGNLGSSTEAAPTGGSGLSGKGLAGGALAGGLAGLLAGTKTGRKIGKHAITYGGTALLGGLAYKAWRDWQQGRPAATSTDPTLTEPPADSPFVPARGEEQQLNRALLRAMVAAVKADGEIDELEQRRILQHLERGDVDAADHAFVQQLLREPADIDAIVRAARCPETAAELYAASLIAIDPSRPAERGYLAMLAARLGLEQALVEHLHAAVSQATAYASGSQ
jgi:uncharacterized membrane protein YebE (DUF533 family)